MQPGSGQQHPGFPGAAGELLGWPGTALACTPPILVPQQARQGLHFILLSVVSPLLTPTPSPCAGYINPAAMQAFLQPAPQLQGVPGHALLAQRLAVIPPGCVALRVLRGGSDVRVLRNALLAAFEKRLPTCCSSVCICEQTSCKHHDEHTQQLSALSVRLSSCPHKTHKHMWRVFAGVVPAVAVVVVVVVAVGSKTTGPNRCLEWPVS